MRDLRNGSRKENMNIRGFERTEFPRKVKAAAFKRCCRDGKPYCEGCGIELRGGNIVYEHVTPDGFAGEPTLENCKVHCKTCADRKTFTEDNPRMAKADRSLKRQYGIATGKPSAWACGRNSKFRKKINGKVELR